MVCSLLNEIYSYNQEVYTIHFLSHGIDLTFSFLHCRTGTSFLNSSWIAPMKTFLHNVIFYRVCCHVIYYVGHLRVRALIMKVDLYLVSPFLLRLDRRTTSGRCSCNNVLQMWQQCETQFHMRLATALMSLQYRARNKIFNVFANGRCLYNNETCSGP